MIIKIALNELCKIQFLVILLLWPLLSTAQNIEPPDSFAFMKYSGKELYHKECWDTFKFLFLKKPIELGLIFPAWQAIDGHQKFTELEGIVSMQTPENEIRGPHVSEEDFPNYHYSHDFCFNVFPDSAYKYLLCYFNTKEGQWAYRKHMHVEWEMGMGNGNKTNPLREEMCKGNSAGFISYGHQRQQPLEHLPAVGDWVHLEGIYVWDRGHPPAKTEIHPIFFMLIKRRTPEWVQGKPALRLDLFANGDGSAFYNNLPNQPNFVHPVLMNQKDYQVTIKLPDYLQYTDFEIIIQNRQGHTAPISCTIKKTSHNEILLTVPWKTQDINNRAKFHQRIYLISKNEPSKNNYEKVVVQLQELKVQKSLDFFKKPQLRVFTNIHQKYFFINEWSSSDDILNKGWGKSCKRKWKLEISDTLIIHKDSVFRVQFSAWEADGVDKVMGDLLNQNCDCEYLTKKTLTKKLLNLKLLFRGCKDDVLREGFAYHKPSEIQNKQTFILFNHGEVQDDPCPFGKFNSSKRLKLVYTIKKLNH